MLPTPAVLVVKATLVNKEVPTLHVVLPTPPYLFPVPVLPTLNAVLTTVINLFVPTPTRLVQAVAPVKVFVVMS